MAEMSVGGSYVDLSGEQLRTYYATPSGELLDTVIHGVDPTLHVPLAVSVGSGGPEHIDAGRLCGLRQRGRMVLAVRIGGRPVLLAVVEIAREVRAAAGAARPAVPVVTTTVTTTTAPSASSSSAEAEDADMEEPATGRWEESDEDEPARVPAQTARPAAGSAPQRPADPEEPTADEVAARMARGLRFSTPRGRSCYFSDQGDSAVRHFFEYQRSRKEQTAVFFSNVRRYTPLEYLQTLQAACDAAIDMYAARTAVFGQNCRVPDAAGRQWTIGMTREGGEYRLTHAHFENYQNS
ncbi:hypothetical protein ACGFXC_22580 [Streptomyces sp. NPDC048507]|uniref:hypothetical protein n=1 Tax=Streptomyces sp. NPDC048507 TaxID=3365560 RepID=UPI003720447E